MSKQTSRIGWLVASATFALLTMTATGQAVIDDGAFVRGMDGSTWIVTGGQKRPIAWTEDTQGALDMLATGAPIGNIAAVGPTLALAPTASPSPQPTPAPMASADPRAAQYAVAARTVASTLPQLDVRNDDIGFVNQNPTTAYRSYELLHRAVQSSRQLLVDPAPCQLEGHQSVMAGFSTLERANELAERLFGVTRPNRDSPIVTISRWPMSPEDLQLLNSTYRRGLFELQMGISQVLAAC